MIDYSKINVEIDDPELYKLARKGANLLIIWNGIKIKVPKVIRGYRKENEKTKTELKRLWLMPTEPPIGYSFQQFNGEMYFLYDIDKTKKFEISEEAKLAAKEYRKNLKIRKTCPICNKVQKHISEMETRYLFTGEEYYSCLNCFELKEFKIMQQRRNVKNDFTSYFNKRGIDIYTTIDETEIYDIVFLDFETTGTSSSYDEILQVSIIDNKDKVLFYKLCKPIANSTWDEAMNINGITPKDVENEKPFEYYIKDISKILLRAKKIVCYNCPFELAFLKKYKVNYSENNSESKFEDCMIMFASIYGEFNDYYGNFKWQSLSTAAHYYGYKFEGQEHNSLADVFATKFVYEKIVASTP